MTKKPRAAEMGHDQLPFEYVKFKMCYIQVRIFRKQLNNLNILKPYKVSLKCFHRCEAI